jgi:hypothetical protein
MKSLAIKFLKSIQLYYLLKNWLSRLRQVIELKTWEKEGCPNPPPHIIKQKLIKKYAKEFNLKILVESGTYYGDMVEAQSKNFERIYSIELSPILFSYATERFKSKTNIELIQGDSGIEIEKIMKKIGQPALFWLDGHYSAGETAKGKTDTPILEELEHILSSGKLAHVIIIDDARLFGSNPAYPSLESLEKFVYSKRPNVEISVSYDSIRITPR